MGSRRVEHDRPLHFNFSLSCIGEGNGNPLQCSCLEHLRDGGAWWAAVYGVTQSRTQLKRLSSSSSSSSSNHKLKIQVSQKAIWSGEVGYREHWLVYCSAILLCLSGRCTWQGFLPVFHLAVSAGRRTCQCRQPSIPLEGSLGAGLLLSALLLG